VTDTTVKLQALGLEFVSPVGQESAYAELYRAARRLRDSGRKVVGLLPASSAVAVCPVALQLGHTLAEAYDEPVSLIDANTRYPALSSLAAELVPQPDGRPLDRPVFVSVKISECFSVVVPAGPRTSSVDIDLLTKAIALQRQSDSHVLVDLTGFSATAEHWDTFSLLDALLLVARTAETREKDLIARHTELPKELRLGVLLVG
jgi:hypothetical protein